MCVVGFVDGGTDRVDVLVLMLFFVLLWTVYLRCGVGDSEYGVFVRSGVGVVCVDDSVEVDLIAIDGVFSWNV